MMSLASNPLGLLGNARTTGKDVMQTAYMAGQRAQLEGVFQSRYPDAVLFLLSD